MLKRLLFILCLAIISSGSVFAQKKNITNADLEKFRQKRLQAEKDYRENYEKLGMPSPEELQARDEQRRRETAEAAAKFRAERIQEEQNQALREQAEAEQRYYQQQSLNDYTPRYTANNFGYLPFNYFPYGSYNYSFARRYSPRFHYNNGRYFGNQIPPIRITPSIRQPIHQPVFPSNNPRFPRGRH